VEYLERGGEGGGPGTADRAKRGVDYKEVLSAEDFAVFAKLRDLRKEMAEKEGVPPYAVFTNEQLAAMVTTKADTQAALAKIDGIGSARIEKYAAAFLEALKTVARASSCPEPEANGVRRSLMPS
jgi:superfamily II DNA helicase RecQ